MVSEDSWRRKTAQSPKHRERHATLSTIGDWQPAAIARRSSCSPNKTASRARTASAAARAHVRLALYVLPRLGHSDGSDLASLPVSGIEVQICGDAHIANFGVYASPNATSCSISTTSTKPRPDRGNGRAAHGHQRSPRSAGPRLSHRSRRNGPAQRGGLPAEMDAYAEMSPVDIWYDHLDVREIINGTPKKRREVLERQLARGKKRRTPIGAQDHGRRPAALRGSTSNLPPHGLEDEDAPDALAMLEAYRTSLPDNVRALFDRYAIVDTALKSSRGKRRNAVLCLPASRRLRRSAVTAD